VEVGVPSDRFVVGAPLGRWQTNCYVIGDRDLETAVVVDPGEDGESWVPEILGQLEVTCERILLTHAHLDHLWSVPDLAAKLDVPVHLHSDDRWLWDDPAAGIGMPAAMLEELTGTAWDPPTERLEDLADGQQLAVAGTSLTVRHTPGHTPGHVVFLADGLVGAEVLFGRPLREPTGDMLFSGDLIFAGSVGRTDFPRGSHEQLLESIDQAVLPLEDDTLILSGHGPETTVGLERSRNPFVAELVRRET
jgi:hydroxyacylglutathione hydrolase